MTATLPKPVARGFPVPIAPVPGGQICTYTIALRSCSPFATAIETFPVSFDRPISDQQLREWLTPWMECGYELIEVHPSQWRVRNPTTGEYEVVWESGE